MKSQKIKNLEFPDPCLKLEFIASAPNKSVTGLKKLYMKFLFKFINSKTSLGSIININKTKIIMQELAKKFLLYI